MRKLFRLVILTLAVFGAKSLYDQYGAQIRTMLGQFSSGGAPGSIDYPAATVADPMTTDEDIAI